MSAYADKGNLTKDWERGQGDRAPYKSRIAINGAVKLLEKDANGKPQFDAMFMDVVAFPGTPAFNFIERMANANKPTGKGSHLEFNGRLKGEQWKDKDGNVRTSYFVEAYDLDFAASAARKSDGANQAQGQSTAGNTPAQQPAQQQQAPAAAAPQGFALDL